MRTISDYPTNFDTTRATTTATPLVIEIWVALVALKFFLCQYFNTCPGIGTTITKWTLAILVG